ncbi:MAG: hypothetical protein C4521_07660 [Actinobacteria bacterium]|nr:MAG: hypothetical protein C4521_07660 [Actinomycetota bacterium]
MGGAKENSALWRYGTGRHKFEGSKLLGGLEADVTKAVERGSRSRLLPSDYHPVPKSKRVRSRKNVESVRKPYCEFCGALAYGLPHHLKSRGSGGGDQQENQVQLCGHHHRLAHNGRLSPDILVALVAARERISETEVRRAIGWEV